MLVIESLGESGVLWWNLRDRFCWCILGDEFGSTGRNISELNEGLASKDARV